MTALYDTYGPYGTDRTGVPVGTVLDCGDTLAPPESIGTGYAGTADGRMICYRHAEDAEAADFVAAEHFSCYVTPIRPGQSQVGDGIRNAAGGYHVTTWTGRELARVVSYSDSRAHPSGGIMRSVRVVGFDGSRWYGRYMPDWSELVTLHRAKGGKA